MEQGRLQCLGIAVTAGIPGPARSERALSCSPPASPLLRQPECPGTGILQLSPSPKEPFSTRCQAPQQSGRWWLGDKGVLEPLSQTGTHLCTLGVQFRREHEGHRKGAAMLVGTRVSPKRGGHRGWPGGNQLFALQLLCLT